MPPSRKRRLVYLTGFMGSGKSTIAPILANSLGYSFTDIDDEIQKASGKRIAEMFAEEGESVFRELERRLLVEASRSDERVISLGGGTIANEANFALVKSSGILIYLEADIDQILHRLRNKTDRPLLKSADGAILEPADLRRRVTDLLLIREPYYRRADITFSTGSHTIGRTVDELARMIRSLSD